MERSLTAQAILVHYHIFKNAGSSVDKLLRDNFGENWNSFEGQTATSLLCSSDLVDFLTERPHLRAVSSHLLRPPAPRRFEIIPIVFLRHPLDRAFSVYCQERRTTPTLPSTRAAHEHDFAGYIRWCLDHPGEGGVVVIDYQVIHLSDASFRHDHIYKAEATRQDLMSVIQYLSGIPFFGVVDTFDRSMQYLCRLATAAGLPLTYSSVRENVTEGRDGILAERLEDLESRLPTALRRRFAEANELDHRLYDWAVKNHPANVRSYDAATAAGAQLVRVHS